MVIDGRCGGCQDHVMEGDIEVEAKRFSQVAAIAGDHGICQAISFNLSYFQYIPTICPDIPHENVIRRPSCPLGFQLFNLLLAVRQCQLIAQGLTICLGSGRFVESCEDFAASLKSKTRA